MSASNPVDHTTSAPQSLSEKISHMTAQLPPDQVTLSEIIDIVGDEGLLILSILLSLIFLVPVSIPGVSTVFGLAILLIGCTRLFAGKLWLPKKIGARPLPAAKLAAGFRQAMGWLQRLEKVSKPHRLPVLVDSAFFNILNNLVFTLAAVLLMMPFGLIPFSNTLPAVAIIFLAIGMMQRDGGSVLLGHAANIATIIYFAAIVWGGLAVGQAVSG